jgi:hypothetical protein
MSIVRRACMLSLALAAALAACGDGSITTPPTDLLLGSFEVEVSGDTSFSARGNAVYRSPQMVLTDQLGMSDGDFFQLFVDVPATPQERRYEGMTNGTTVLFVVRGGVIVRQFGSTSGWVDLYEVAEGNVSGYGEMVLQEYDANAQPIPGNRITVRPVFNATRP